MQAMGKRCEGISLHQLYLISSATLAITWGYDMQQYTQSLCGEEVETHKSSKLGGGE